VVPSADAASIARMDASRGCLGVAAMMFFLATVLIGWLMMVVAPVLSGEPPLANIGVLVLCTAGSLLVWRLAGGKDWGLGSGDDRQQAPTGAAASDSPRLQRDWAFVLSHQGVEIAELRDLVDGIYRSAPPETVRPERRDVFRAFDLTPLPDMRVVILGQDPYPGEGRADGLAFSVRPGVAIPHSLDRVFANLAADSRLAFQRPATGDLSPWARQGVLLLNTALTHQERDRSHRDQWRPFTRSVLEYVNERRRHIVFLLWGDDANDLADEVGLDPTRHRLVRSTHPRREEPSARYPRFAATRPFSEANEQLQHWGRQPVDWTL
jgi:uracil-DNA glycosylase